MTLKELVRQWDEDGELDAEFQQFMVILERRELTRADILRCFETQSANLCLMAAAELDRCPTLEEVRAKYQSYYADPVKVIEVTLQMVEYSKKPEEEVLRDLLRDIDNQLWQQQEDEESDEDVV